MSQPARSLLPRSACARVRFQRTPARRPRPSVKQARMMKPRSLPGTAERRLWPRMLGVIVRWSVRSPRRSLAESSHPRGDLRPSGGRSFARASRSLSAPTSSMLHPSTRTGFALGLKALFSQLLIKFYNFIAQISRTRSFLSPQDEFPHVCTFVQVQNWQ